MVTVCYQNTVTRSGITSMCLWCNISVRNSYKTAMIFPLLQILSTTNRCHPYLTWCTSSSLENDDKPKYKQKTNTLGTMWVEIMVHVWLLILFSWCGIWPFVFDRVNWFCIYSQQHSLIGFETIRKNIIMNLTFLRLSINFRVIV